MSEPVGRLRSLILTVPSAVRRDYAATVAVHCCTLAAGLLIFHLVARRGGVAGFGFYQVARGSVSALQPLGLLGLGAGLPRYLPRAGAVAPALVRRAFAVQLALLGAIALLVLPYARPVAHSIGLAGGPESVAAVVVLLAGNCLCTTAVAALRGTGQVAYANLTSLTGFGIVPVVAFAAAHRIGIFLFVCGAGMTAAAAAGAAVMRPSGTACAGSPPAFATVLRYGLRRVLGDLALPGVFALPTFAVAVARPGAPEVGYVGFTTSAITLVCAFFGMLTPVLLPRLSAHFHHGGGEPSLHRALALLPLAAGGSAALLALLIAVPAPWLIHHFLGRQFAPAVGLLRIGIVAAIPLAVFYAVRPTLDALHEAPITGRLVVGELLLQALLTFALARFLSVPIAAVLALGMAATALGAACLVALRRALARRAV